jgi:hypothetical protein
MKKISCDIVRDLLPLYVEDLASSDSKKMIEEHIAVCPDCAKQLQEMQESITLPADTVIAPLTILKRKMNKKKINIILITAAAVMSIAILVLAWLHAPICLEYNQDLIRFDSHENGRVLVTLSAGADGYNVSSYPAKTVDGKTAEGDIYHITVWDSLWNKYIAKGKEQSFILNASSDGSYRKVTSVYYYKDNSRGATENESDLLIYGEGREEEVTTLPRLALAYYAYFSLIAVIACVVIWIVFRKREKVCRLMEKITALPAAYLISQLCIKGFNTASYSLQFDFLSILLLSIPVYVALTAAIGAINPGLHLMRINF